MNADRAPVLVVLAGGLGTRLCPAIGELPKPLAPVAGRPFIEHVLDHWIDQGVREVVLAVGYRAQDFRERYERGYRGHSVRIVADPAPLGTGGALIQAAATLGTSARLLAVNGDTLLDAALASLIEFHERSRSGFTLALSLATPTTRASRVRLASGDRLETVESPDGPWLNAGTYLVEASCLAGLLPEPQSLERVLLPRLIAAGNPVYGFRTNVPFLDIGVPSDYAQAARWLDAWRGRSASS